jgi:hypothetical protein
MDIGSGRHVAPAEYVKVTSGQSHVLRDLAVNGSLCHWPCCSCCHQLVIECNGLNVSMAPACRAEVPQPWPCSARPGWDCWPLAPSWSDPCVMHLLYCRPCLTCAIVTCNAHVTETLAGDWRRLTHGHLGPLSCFSTSEQRHRMEY